MRSMRPQISSRIWVYIRKSSYTKAFAYNALDKITMEQRKNTGGALEISYLGRLHTADYGKRMRMSAFHVMPENGVMLQMTEVGMKGMCLERVE